MDQENTFAEILHQKDLIAQAQSNRGMSLMKPRAADECRVAEALALLVL